MDTSDHKYVIVSCFLLVEHNIIPNTLPWDLAGKVAVGWLISNTHSYAIEYLIPCEVWLKPTIILSG